MHLPYAHRYPIQCPITFLGDHLMGEGTVHNISTGVWKADSDQPVQRGNYFGLRVLLLDQAVPMKVDLAVVRWSSEREFGLEFVRMYPEEQARLRRFLSTLETATSHSCATESAACQTSLL